MGGVGGPGHNSCTTEPHTSLSVRICLIQERTIGADPNGLCLHHLTVDVEEYFHVAAMERYLPRSHWAHMESRVVRNTEVLLDLLDEYRVQGTFFVLGMVARDHPELVRELARRGHEVASHGWDHRRLDDLTPEQFRDQARQSRALLEELAGEPVRGYRAPSFSITPGREWALEILVEEGYRYDSSLYPVRRPGYGYPGGLRRIHTLELTSGSLVEVPPATVRFPESERFPGVNLPAGGGGSLRHLPLGLIRGALSRFQSQGERATLYLHPWELDTNQPRVPGLGLLTRLRHYRGLGRTEDRLRQLLGAFCFQSIAETMKEDLTWESRSLKGKGRGSSKEGASR